MPITTTFISVVTPTAVITTGSSVQNPTPGWQIIDSTKNIASTVTNLTVERIQTIVGKNTLGYGLGSYFSLPVNTSTRALARTYNSLLTDLDLVLRHITSASVVNTQTQLSTWTTDLVVSTGTRITATAWQRVIDLTDFAELNQYNVHPGQLAVDPSGCTVTYDQSLSSRNTAWGTGTSRTISMTVEAEWPRSYLADSFFNLGGDFVFSPFLPSMGLVTDDPSATGLVSYQFDTAQNSLTLRPVSINQQGSGLGPLYHVDFNLWPYGQGRDPVTEYTKYYYPEVGGPPVTGNAGLSTQNPQIVGTVFQFVGVHYGDYTTSLAIGVRQGQILPTTSQRLRIAMTGTNATGVDYTITVPGRFAYYTGATAQGTLDSQDMSGWWVSEYDSATESYQDRCYSWIDIYTGRKGSDPLGLTLAVQNQSPHWLTILPVDTGATTTAASTSTVTNAWAQFVGYLQGGVAQSWTYSRTQWRDPVYQSTVTTFSTGTQTTTIILRATRDQGTVGLSRRIVFTLTATNYLVGDPVTIDNAYTYTTSSQTCTNIVSVSNSFDSATGDNTGTGGDDDNFPWWIVPVVVAVVAGVCFTGDTLILMEDLTRRPIRSLRPGDRVWNWNKTRVNTVLFVEEKFREDVVVYSPSKQYQPFITDNHPVIIDGCIASPDPERHWKLYPWLGQAKQIPDPVLGRLSPQIVYNLWLDGDHTYWVNEWATHSIINDGAFLRRAVEDNHITRSQTIDILESHTGSDSFLLTGSYYVNKLLAKIDSPVITDYMAKTLSGRDNVAKSALRFGMRAVGLVTRPYLYVKYRMLKQKFKFKE